MDISAIDKTLQLASLVRASEEGYARDYRSGSAFGPEGDRQRLDAFIVGFLDAFTRESNSIEGLLDLLVYLHLLQQFGPGPAASIGVSDMLGLAADTTFSIYTAGGRRYAIQVLAFSPPEVGQFARLLAKELGAV